MERFARYFVIMSLIYLLLGASLGVLMVSYPGRGEWSDLGYYLIPSHTHLNLIGWVSMMIFGVAYHVIPRFSGKQIYSRKLGWAHFILAQIGLVGMATFFFLNRFQDGQWKRPLMVSGILMYLSICAFVFNMLKTLLSKPALEVRG